MSATVVMRDPIGSNVFARFKSIPLFLLLGLLGCLTPIDFPADTGEQRIVIMGQVSNLIDQNIVQVGITAKTQRLPFPIKEATVSLFEEHTNASYYYQESQSKPGDYVLEGFSGHPGSTYYLNVVLPTGETYQSQPERMPFTSGTIFSHKEFVIETVTDNESVRSEKTLIKIYANSLLPDSPEDIYLKWSVEEVFALVPTAFPGGFGNTPGTCYITQNADPQRIALFNGGEVTVVNVNNILVTNRIIDYSFFSRHYFTTYQSSITKEAYDYWNKVNALVNQVGSIFDTPPAEITGNLVNIKDSDEKVLGYFQAINQTYDRFFVVKADLPFPILWQDCSYTNTVKDYPTRCFNCLSLQNSSLERPSWF